MPDREPLAAVRSESETRCPMCERVIREDDLYEDGCPFCGTWIDDGAAGRVHRYEAALEKIAAGRRPDGTYNLSRAACEQIAKEALSWGR